MNRNVLLAAMLVLPLSASATFIVNRAETFAYNPAHDVHEQVFNGLTQWDAAGRTSHVQAYSESHPFDPPINKAEAWGTFNQFASPGSEANYHNYSAVVGEYNAIQEIPYEAISTLEVRQELVFTTDVDAVIYAVVAAHGLFTALGNNGVNAISRASINIAADDGANTHYYNGALSVTGREIGLAPTLSTSGAWNGAVLPHEYLAPFGTSEGFELASLSSFIIGAAEDHTSKNISIQYRATSSAYIQMSRGSHAFADLSNTAGLTFEARDGSGHLVDLDVRVVPEPGSLVVLGLGFVLFLRRKK